ncbi:hypothetical protein N7495_009110 [Penicillium taxi]|uniref:uncharacterized protein n=1 Tax=Penicillium taxi TaxID=168475 RepID=UPI0025458DFC|nr:uncharacterized protein N7495_009110 [Penicillium taxi]KAJ5889069.1 hypothetical protein N7495_009110 [Penicillium taxi]
MASRNEIHINDLPESIDSITFDAAGLGKLKGFLFDGSISQFNNIPYGEVPGRWMSALPVKTPWEQEGVRDAQKHGTYCPQPPRRFYPIPLIDRPYTPMPTQDEFTCLNLNITIPASSPPLGSPLPVLLWIHGGGLAAGTGNAPMMDGRVLAAMSVQMGLPTLVITLNYRLGVFGFMTNSDIKNVNSASGQQTANWGLYDQRLAIEWVQTHISAFGGDPSNVTIFGESAGSTSVHWHLSGPALFRRAILMSGTTSTCGISTTEQYNAAWHRLADHFGVSKTLSAAERVNAMRKISAQDCLVSHDLHDCLIPVAQVCDDGKVNLWKWGDTEAKFPVWCDVMLGDCKNEGILFDHRGRLDLNGQQLIDDLEKFMGRADAATIIDAYDITAELTTEQGWAKIEHMLTHSVFSLPNYTLAKANSNVLLYHFDEPSTFDEGIVDGERAPNAWKNFAHHALDDKYIFNVLRPLMTSSQKKVAESMAYDWLSFAHGKDPWPRFDIKTSPFVKTFGPEGKSEVKTLEADNQKRAYDSMEKVLQAGLSGKFGDWGEERAENRSDLLRDPWV